MAKNEIPQSYTWFFTPPLEKGKCGWFYNPIDQKDHAVDVGDFICSFWTYCHDWLVLSSKNYPRQFSLFHMASKQTIKLPYLQLYDNWRYTLMTAPPTASNCIFAVVSPTTKRIFIWRPNQLNWRIIKYGSQTILSHLRVCNQNIYGLVELKYFARFDIEKDTFKITILGPPPFSLKRGCLNENHIIQNRVIQINEVKCNKFINIIDEYEDEDIDEEKYEDEYGGEDIDEEEYEDEYGGDDGNGDEKPGDYADDDDFDQLVGCGDDIFFIKISKGSSRVVECISVYKFDEINARWIKVKNIDDDHAIFLNKGHSYSYSTKNSSVKGNSIYFLDSGPCPRILIYNIKDDIMDMHFPKHHKTRYSYSLINCEKWF